MCVCASGRPSLAAENGTTTRTRRHKPVHACPQHRNPVGTRYRRMLATWMPSLFARAQPAIPAINQCSPDDRLFKNLARIMDHPTTVLLLTLHRRVTSPLLLVVLLPVNSTRPVHMLNSKLPCSRRHPSTARRLTHSLHHHRPTLSNSQDTTDTHLGYSPSPSSEPDSQLHTRPICSNDLAPTIPPTPRLTTAEARRNSLNQAIHSSPSSHHTSHSNLIKHHRRRLHSKRRPSRRNTRTAHLRTCTTTTAQLLSGLCIRRVTRASRLHNLHDPTSTSHPSTPPSYQPANWKSLRPCRPPRLTCPTSAV